MSKYAEEIGLQKCFFSSGRLMDDNAQMGVIPLQLAKFLTGGLNDRSRNPGQLSNLQTIALIGRTGFDTVQKYDAAVMLSSVEMDIADIGKTVS